MHSNFRRGISLLGLSVLAISAISSIGRVPMASSATITRVQVNGATTGATGSSVSVSLASPVAAGNFLAVLVFGPSAITSVSDAQGDTFTPVYNTSLGMNWYIAMYYAANAKGGATSITAANATSSYGMGIIAAEYQGVATSSPLGTYATQFSSASPYSSGAISVQAGDLLIGQMFDNWTGAAGFTPGAGWALAFDAGGASGVDHAMADQLAPAASLIANTGTATIGGIWAGVASFHAAASSGGGTVTPPPTDTTPPSVPTGLTATNITQTSITLSWNPSTDNVGVTGYNIYRNGGLIGNAGVTSFTNTSLTAGTNYSYAVAAYDAAGNLSAQSSPLSVVTAAAAPANATTFYIDYQNGNDANDGATKATPWQHLPGMQGCTGNCAANVPKAGNQYILKGGVTWPNASFPITWTWSGVSGNPIYIGVDQTWYAGSAWTRPIFDAQGQAIAGMNIFIYGLRSSYQTWDNIEVKGFYWNGTCGYGRCGVGSWGAGTNITIDHFYIHGWTHAGTTTATLTSCSGTCDDFKAFVGDTNAPYESGSIIMHTIMDGSDSTNGGDSGEFSYAWPSAKWNVIHDVSNGILPIGHGEIAYNLIYNIKPSFDISSHENSIETLGSDGAFYIHDNINYHSVGETLMISNPGETDYVWNNVLYDEWQSSSVFANPPHFSQNNAVGLAMYFWNNTIVPRTGVQCFLGTGTWPTIVIQNNHCVSDTGLMNSFSATSLTVDHNVVESPSAAAAEGYNSTQAYAYSPTSLSNSTVGAGANLSGNCSGALAGLCSDVTYACRVGAGNQVVCPVRTAVARPSAGAWDAGAYQYGSGGSAPAPDTTPPAVSLASPSSGSTVSGTTSVTANATDNVGVTKVEFYLDSALQQTDTTSPYTWSWNTAAATNGSHVLIAKAYDAANNIGTSAGVSVTVQNGTGNTYYVDYVGGSDSNSGLSRTSPWKYGPGMYSCSSVCKSTVLKAGDSVIFKGGVSWPNSSFAWSLKGGSTGNPIYYGADKTWYAGSSWTRPILNAGGIAITNNYDTMIFMPAWTTVDNFEIKGFYWDNAACAGAPFGDCGIFNIGQQDGTVISNIYFHGWTHAGVDGASNNGVSNFVQGNGGPNSVAHDNIIDGSDVPGDHSMNGFFSGPPTAYRNFIRQVSSGFIVTTNGMQGSFHDNHIEDVGPAYCNLPFSLYAGQCTHENGFEDNGSTGLDFYNNVISNVSAGLAVWIAPNPAYSARIWNNLIYGVHDNQVLDLAPPVYNPTFCSTGANSQHYCNNTGTFLVYNNTIQCGDDATQYDLCQSNLKFPSAAKMEFRNNHFISYSAASGCAAGATNCIFAPSNAVMSQATANAQGYLSTSAFAFRPISGSGGTIASGESLSGLAVGTMTSLAQDTTYAVGYDAVNHVIISPARTALARPASGPWDAGAYQYTSGSGTPVTPPPPADTTPPTVSLTTPASGASYLTTSGAITVLASASDNVGVTQVQFKLDGANLGAPVTQVPYQVFLNPASLTVGTHTLSAVASDAAGNTGAAANVTITIAAPTTTPTSTPTTTTTTPPPATGGGGGGGSAYVPPPPASTGGGSSYIPPVTPTSTGPFPRPLAMGDYGLDVTLLNLVLASLNYLPSSLAQGNTFTIATQHALSLFQQDHQLAQTGSLGPQSQDLMNKVVRANPALNASVSGGQGTTPAPAPTPAFTRNLGLGMTGDDVTRLQTYLQTKGFLTATPTGYYGLLTQAAVQKFQCAEGLVCTGSPQATGYGAVGPKTRTHLNERVGGTTSEPTPTPTTPAPTSATTRTLLRGLQGDDVTSLQTYLIQQGFLAPQYATGFYGALTESAVQAFQCAKGIVCQGSPATTGYGIVGPRTRGEMR